MFQLSVLQWTLNAKTTERTSPEKILFATETLTVSKLKQTFFV